MNQIEQSETSAKVTTYHPILNQQRIYHNSVEQVIIMQLYED